jgi:hypothetical protein
MNRPKARPSSSALSKQSEVLAGLHRLPGASNFDKPSIKTTPIKKTVDAIPRSEAYDRRDSGMKTVGVMLEKDGLVSKWGQGRTTGARIHDETKQLVGIW